MLDLAPCPRCDAPRPFDIHGTCRTCGARIAPPTPTAGVRLDIPKTWSELWPTLAFSSILLLGGVTLLAAGVWIFNNFPVENDRIGIVLGFFGVALIGCAGKCWLK